MRELFGSSLFEENTFSRSIPKAQPCLRLCNVGSACTYVGMHVCKEAEKTDV